MTALASRRAVMGAVAAFPASVALAGDHDPWAPLMASAGIIHLMLPTVFEHAKRAGLDPAGLSMIMVGGPGCGPEKPYAMFNLWGHDERAYATVDRFGLRSHL